MAMHFIGTGSNIPVAGFPAVASKFSLAVWIYIASTPGASTFYTIIDKNIQSAGDHRNFAIDYRTSAGVTGLDLNWTTAANTYVEYKKTVTLSTVTWIHLAFSIDWTTNPDSVALYLNGAAQTLTLVGSNNSTPESASTTDTRIGAAAAGTSNYYIGDMAEMAAWTEIISQDEVTSLSNGYTPRLVKPQNLIFYVPLLRELIDVRQALVMNLTGVTNPPTPSDHPRMIYGSR